MLDLGLLSERQSFLSLERQIQVVGHKAPHSHAKCAEQAVPIKALMVSDGMPSLWIMLNPSDLKSPLVLSLAGVEFETDIASHTAIAKIREKTATMNPVAVASIF